MSSYKISFDQIRQDHALSDMLKALERGLEKFNIDYYLVGAVSRDVWMSGINSIPPKRTTGDIDFAVFINDKGIYEQLKEYLIKNENFSPFKENAFVLIWKDGTEVDLLPFGAVEDEDRKSPLVELAIPVCMLMVLKKYTIRNYRRLIWKGYTGLSSALYQGSFY